MSIYGESTSDEAGASVPPGSETSETSSEASSPEAAAESGGGSSPMLWVGVGALVLALAAGDLVLGRRGRSTSSRSEDGQRGLSGARGAMDA